MWNAGHQQGKWRKSLNELQHCQVVVMLDFKEKPKLTYRLVEQQSEHWDNKLQSLLGVIIVSKGPGPDDTLCREYIDVCSEVSTQDSDWVVSALQAHILPILKAKHSHITELIGWSDNGSHFSNNMFLACWGTIGAALKAEVEWNFTEPGEGKSDNDRHFAQIKPRILQFVRDHEKLHGARDLAAACSTIKNTTGVVLKLASHKIKQYMVVPGLRKYISFRMPNNGKSYGDAKYVSGRELTHSGPWCLLEAGKLSKRQLKE